MGRSCLAAGSGPDRACRTIAGTLVGAVTLAALAAPAPVAGQGAAGRERPPLCSGAGIRVEAGFARAGARSCNVRVISGVPTVQLEIRPETLPINPSPWYGVRLNASRPRTVDVVLDYGTHRHRYRPHVRHGDGAWQTVPADRVIVAASGSQATVRLALEPGTTTMAAQPFDPPARITAMLDRATADGVLARTTIGQSVAGLPILAYASVPQSPTGSFILLARQHPPEVAGEWAFDAFTATVLADTDLARSFRARFAILFLPLINPDGIAGGYWRTNRGLVDLNRDWGPFTQPETRAAADHIRQFVADRPAVGMIDFHATDRDVIYAQPASAELFPPGFADGWLADWTAQLGPRAPGIDRGHNASNANSKTWGRLTLGVAAMTYEVGDNTARADAEANAQLAAEAMMRAALALPVASQSPPVLEAVP
jgi:cytosolic carboxypeptidase protein 6